MLKIRSGGFVLVEFAIALPLLILVMSGLAVVSLQIFKLGKDQLADYVLEEEAQFVLEQIIQEARFAKEVEITNASNKIKIVYHSIEDAKDNSGSYYHTDGSDFDTEGNRYYMFMDRDVLETRFIYPYKKAGRDYRNLYSERRDGIHNHPITGENFFGDTELISLQYKLDEPKKILHIELVMRSVATNHTITLATAVFMPNYNSE